jgi:tetratricopeptide (TPR) repeat protein
LDSSPLVSIYNVAASISTPLALGAFVAALFFGAGSQITRAMTPAIAKFTGEHAAVVLLTFLTYGFVLSLVGLVGAFGGFAIQYGLKSYIEKQALIDAARQAVANREPDQILRNANALVERWPSDQTGYTLRGTGYFQSGEFQKASLDMKKADALLPRSNDKCDDANVRSKANMIATLGALGEAKQAYEISNEIKACNLQKMMKLNNAKLAMENAFYGEAKAILTLPEMLSESRPDLRSRVHLERSVLSVVQKDEGWENAAISEMRKAVCLDRSFLALIAYGLASAANDPPGYLVEEYRYETGVLNEPVNLPVRERLRSEVLNRDPCA